MPPVRRCLLWAAALIGRGHAALETCELRRGDAVLWDASAAEYRVTRDGAVIGSVVDTAGNRLPWAPKLPWGPEDFAENARGRWVLGGGAYEVATFTDVLAQRQDRAVAEGRLRARSRGCWSAGGYTPDLCCGNGGWDACWTGPFTFESCCTGWTAAKEPDFLAAVRNAFEESHGVLLADPEANSPFYVHALLLAALAGAHAAQLQRPLVLAEVGVDEGAFAAHVMRELRRRDVALERYYAVDPWTGPGAYAEERARAAYLSATRALADFWPAPRVLQERSEVAAKAVPDDLVDLLFVDGVHDYEHVSRDLEVWWPKVRPGGLIAGHDYSPEKPGEMAGCVKAVQEFAARRGATRSLIGLPSSAFVLLKPL